MRVKNKQRWAGKTEKVKTLTNAALSSKSSLWATGANSYAELLEIVQHDSLSFNTRKEKEMGNLNTNAVMVYLMYPLG